MRISDWSSDVCSSDLGDAKPLTRDQACPSGRRQIQVPPISAAARGMSDQGKGEANRPSTALNEKAASAARLPRRVIAPFSRHSLIAGPKRVLSQSLRSIAGLLRAKQKEARKKTRREQ